MAFSASQFRSKLQFGGQRPNLFEVKVTFPNSAGVDEEFTFMCRSTNSPGMTVGVVQVPYFGRMVNFAGDRTYDDWNVQVLNDEDFLVRNAFEKWQDAMNLMRHGTQRTDATGASGGAGQNFYAKATITQFGKGGAPTKIITLVNAFPFQVGQMDLAWDNNDQIQVFDVTFRYDFFETTSQSLV